ncbi:hypothetical protein [Marinicrinis sediminis]|uniref:Cyclic lactone autoinducer peptide n=1 Tax=Marinicrinis sediminis TaxID=1652465 RepID=A0ABW5R9U9_9BACL
MKKKFAKKTSKFLAIIASGLVVSESVFLHIIPIPSELKEKYVK